MPTYDPGRIALHVRGVPIVGIAKGTFVKVARAEDSVKMEVGADGEVTRVLSRNRTGTITFTLQQGSQSNDFLSSMAAEDELTGLGTGATQVQDLNGTTLHYGSTAWVRKPADTEFSDEHTTREWNLDVADLHMHTGKTNF